MPMFCTASSVRLASVLQLGQPGPNTLISITSSLFIIYCFQKRMPFILSPISCAPQPECWQPDQQVPLQYESAHFLELRVFRNNRNLSARNPTDPRVPIRHKPDDLAQPHQPNLLLQGLPDSLSQEWPPICRP